MKNNNEVILERSTYLRIRAILSKSLSKNSGEKPHYNRFLSELNNIEIVEDGTLPVDVIKLNTFIRYKYIGNEDLLEAIPVFPADLSSDSIKISILSPIGLALIGRRENTVSEYVAPGGIYRIKIEEVSQKKQDVMV